jgi:hypothetical protein
LNLEREELTGGWRKLENGKLRNLHCSANIRVINFKENVVRLREEGEVGEVEEVGGEIYK